MKKILLILFLLVFAFNANASSIPDGAIVKTLDNPDIYIIKYNNNKQYKRLVLNPKVFESYGHLKWDNILIISNSEMSSFTTSDLVRVDGSPVVCQLVPEGDSGGKYFLTSLDGYDSDSIYTINDVDFENYSSRGLRGSVTTGDDDQEISDEDYYISAEETKLKAELARKEKVLSVFDELEPILDDINDRMSDLSDQMNDKLEDMEGIKNNSYLSQSSRRGRLSIALSQYYVFAEEYEDLSYKKSRIATIIYELNDYANSGITVPAVDRAYLASLGISVTDF